MLSTGGFLEALNTGKKVPKKAIKKAPPTIMPILIIPKSSIAIPTSFIM